MTKKNKVYLSFCFEKSKLNLEQIRTAFLQKSDNDLPIKKNTFSLNKNMFYAEIQNIYYVI